MSDSDIRTMLFDLEEEVNEERVNSLTFEEKLAMEIIAIEKRFHYGSGSIQRKKEIKEVLDKALREG